MARTRKKILDAVPRDAAVVSVIIPTYKKNQYVDEAVRSALRQKRGFRFRIEVLLCVNGDDYAYYEELLHKFAPSKSVRVLHTSQTGASAGRNIGIDNASGSYIAFLDDDDYLSKRYIGELLAAMSPDVDIVCGRLVDFCQSSGTYDSDTYLNRHLRDCQSRISEDVYNNGAPFGSVCAKLIRTSFLRQCRGFDCTLPNTEDVVFWVDNVDKIHRFALIEPDSTEAYVRRIVDNSRSRPSQSHALQFYIGDRLSIIERCEDKVYEDCSIECKRFVLNKIAAQSNLLLDYYKKLSPEMQRELLSAIESSSSHFINHSRFGLTKGIAFCHNFAPYADASAYAASKRLAQISDIEGCTVNWSVYAATMQSRSSDPLFDLFFARYQYDKLIRIGDRTYFNEEFQEKWGLEACERADNGEEVEIVYSRSLWAGSHVAALRYKSRHPQVRWYAEFSDPLYMGANGEPRPLAREYDGEQEYLNSFYSDLEANVLRSADRVIFTNANQRDYMLAHNPVLDENEKVLVRAKAIVMPHRSLPAQYSEIMNPTYSLDRTQVNIGYFGSFYENRNEASMLALTQNKTISLHIFCPGGKITSTQVGGGHVSVNDAVDHLSFLRLASEMDYLYLNDVDFPDKINPFVPSKLADYLSTGTPVIAEVDYGSVLSQYDSRQIFRTHHLSEAFVNAIVRPGSSPDGDALNYEIALVESRKEKVDDSFVLSVANSWLNGVIDLGFSSLDMPSLDGRGYSWDGFELTKNQNTFYLYYYGLRGAYWLGQAFRLTQNYDFAILANDLVLSFWFASMRSDSISNEMVFNDHALAERIECLCYLCAVFDEQGFGFFQERYIEIIRRDLDLLMDSKKYQRRHNHGIIADKACFCGIAFLNSKITNGYYNQVLERFQEQIDWAFSSDGVHRENSTDYHFSTLGMLQACVSLLEVIDPATAIDVKERLAPAERFAASVLKPNKRRPLFGDSRGLPISTERQNARRDPSYGHVKLNETKDSILRSKLSYYSSGYLFIEDPDASGSEERATWVALRCGYTTRVHKHQDDLSVSLYSKGYDVFIDPGMCGYMPKDERKDYMESMPAHTTIGIKDRPYSIASGNGKKFKILSHRVFEDYDYCLASSHVYRGVSIYRHLYYIRQFKTLIIRDEISSSRENDYIQYFHLGPNLKPEAGFSRNEVLIKLPNQDGLVRMRQVLDTDCVELLEGETTVPPSLVSTGFGSVAPTCTLAFGRNGSDIEFVTVVEVLDEGQSSLLCDIELAESKIIARTDEGKTLFDLPCFKTVPPCLEIPDMRFEKDRLLVTSHISENFAVYAYDEAGPEVRKSGYVSRGQFVDLDLSNMSHATIMFFPKVCTAMCCKAW